MHDAVLVYYYKWGKIIGKHYEGAKIIRHAYDLNLGKVNRSFHSFIPASEPSMTDVYGTLLCIAWLLIRIKFVFGVVRGSFLCFK